MLGCFSQVLRNEGPLGFYKGLIPQLVGQVPEKVCNISPCILDLQSNC